MAIFVLLWVVCGLGAGMVASSKGESGCLWFGLGVLLGPIGLALAFAQADKRVVNVAQPPGRVGLGEPVVEVDLGANTKACPFCAEEIRAAAIKCKHCGEFLVPKCTKCGNHLDPATCQRFCSNCGEPVPGAPPVEPGPVAELKVKIEPTGRAPEILPLPEAPSTATSPWRAGITLLVPVVLIITGIICWFVISDHPVLSSGEPDPLADLPERISVLRQEAEFCQQQHSKACVKAKATELYHLYGAAESKDGIDRSLIREQWRKIAVSGDLGYVPQ